MCNKFYFLLNYVKTFLWKRKDWFSFKDSVPLTTLIGFDGGVVERMFTKDVKRFFLLVEFLTKDDELCIKCSDFSAQTWKVCNVSLTTLEWLENVATFVYFQNIILYYFYFHNTRRRLFACYIIYHAKRKNLERLQKLLKPIKQKVSDYFCKKVC